MNAGSSRRIRPIVLGIFRRRSSILVALGRDPLTEESFCRPPGGGIEFGEESTAALRREMMEELRAEINPPRWMGILENRFTYNGERFHEIVLVYEASFKDRSLYRTEGIDGEERFEGEASGTAVRFEWKRLDDFRSGRSVLYPAGLLSLIDAHARCAAGVSVPRATGTSRPRT